MIFRTSLGTCSIARGDPQCIMGVLVLLYGPRPRPHTPLLRWGQTLRNLSALPKWILPNQQWSRHFPNLSDRWLKW
jgi:hypothetical protein